MSVSNIGASLWSVQNLGYGANGSFAAAGTDGPVSYPHVPQLDEYARVIPLNPITITPQQNDVSNVAGFVALAALVAGVGTIVANLTVARALQASITGTSTVGPALSVSRPLAAVVAGSSTVQGALLVARRLATVITGQGTVTADLTVGAAGVLRALAATIAGTSTVQAGLKVSRRIAASITGTGTVTANTSISRRLSTLVAGTAVVSVTRLALVERLSSTVSGASQILAALSIVGSIPSPTITLALLRRRRMLRHSGGTIARKRRNW